MRTTRFPSVLVPALGLVLAAAVLVQSGCAPAPPVVTAPRRAPIVFAAHILLDRSAASSMEGLRREIPEMAKAGVNLIFLEVDYNYEYVSHPELRGNDPLSRAQAKEIVALCRAHKVRLVPEFQSLGHQSWAETTYSLLAKYPQFDETPGKYPGNKDIYCRSWCPYHPDLYPIVNALYDELIEVFEADGLHVGMDEVFLIADPDCPRCKDKTTAECFAYAVNRAHDHLVREKGVEMFMWADRFIDGTNTYGEWESSTNGTHPAIDAVPKDIILCDWHYERKYTRMKTMGFPSVGMFLDKGFRVLPTSYRDTKAVRMLIRESFAFPSERMLGHCCTTWGGIKAGSIHRSKQFKAIAKELRRYGLRPA